MQREISTCQLSCVRSMLTNASSVSSYPTFKALLYYLYTDSIFFTPLSSTYHVAKEAAQLQARSFPFPTRRSYLLAATGYNPSMMGKSAPSPCSAKAIYRLADKLGLIELKKRAYDHIIRSLTVENVRCAYVCLYQRDD